MRTSRTIFTTMQWATIVGGLVVAGISVTAWAFQTFEQKSDLIDILMQIDNRLSRIENVIIKK